MDTIHQGFVSGADLQSREPVATIKPAFHATFRAYFSLSQTQRRLAHEACREAARWEAAGNYQNFAALMLEARRLRREAWWHLERARLNYERSVQ